MAPETLYAAGHRFDEPRIAAVRETACAPNSYPCSLRLSDLEVGLRLMTADDEEKVLAFSRSLSEHDLLFLPVDLTRREAVRSWIEDIESGRTVTVLAEVDGQLAGYGSLHRSELLWIRHLGEIRLLVSSQYRRHGIGGELARQIFELAHTTDLHKLMVNMMSTQRDAQALFHRLGFIPEALLNDWVIDRAGRMHDLIVMSREVGDVESEDDEPP